MLDDLQQHLTVAHIDAKLYALAPLGPYCEPKTYAVEYHLTVAGRFVRIDHRYASAVYDAYRGGEAYSGDVDGLCKWLAEGMAWQGERRE